MKVALDIIGVALCLCLIVGAAVAFIVLLGSGVFVMALIAALVTYGIAQLKRSPPAP